MRIDPIVPLSPARQRLLEILADLKPEVGAEVGVQRGHFALALLEKLPGRHVMIDAWRYFEKGYEDGSNCSNVEHGAILLQARHHTQKNEGRVVIMVATSLQAAALLPDRSLDYVYLDAAHDHENVVKDIRAWLPKVRPGGILCGDDYLQGRFWDSDFGVVSAVEEALGKEIEVLTGEGSIPQWVYRVQMTQTRRRGQK